MPTSKLRQILAIFEEAQQPESLAMLAQQLEIPQPILEDMLNYWVRKGKLRLSSGHQDCGSCGKSEDCAYVVDLPRCYELAAPDNLLAFGAIPNQCEFEAIVPKP